MKTTKQLFSLCLVLALLCTILPVSAAEGVAPSAFKDPVLRDYVMQQFDTDRNGLLSPQECEAVEELTVPNMGLVWMDGIGHFPNLRVLNCRENRIEFLPLSGLSHLKVLDCSQNRLDELSLSGLSELEELYCWNNQLQVLEAVENPALRILECAGNPMRQLSVRETYLLEKLDCRACDLRSLDLTTMPFLTELKCGSNLLTDLDLELFPMLKLLECSGNRLTALHFEHAGIETLDCSYNLLTALSLTPLESLKSLRCDDNRLTELNLESLPHLEEVFCSDNLLSHLTIPANLQKMNCENNCLGSLMFPADSALTYLRCGRNRLMYLNLNELSHLQALGFGENPMAAFHVPQDFSANLEDSDNFFWIVPMQGYDWYDFAGDFRIENVSNVQGGEFRENPRGFFFTEGNTEAFYDYDIGNGCIMHVVLYLGQEPLEITEEIFPDAGLRHYAEAKLDLDRDGKLWKQERDLIGTFWNTLDISRMNISDLTGLEYFPDIQNLDVSDNQLTALELSGRETLANLNCSGNRLSGLELVDLPYLLSVNCARNQLESLYVESPQPAFTLICGDNRLTELDLTGMTGLYSLDCSSNMIRSLKIPHGMKWLDCYSNALSELDLSNCPYLEVLDCRNNELSKLDLSKLPNLLYLDCSWNRMPMLDASFLLEDAEVRAYRNSYLISGWSISAYELGIDPAKVVAAIGGTFQNNVLTMNFGNQEMWFLYEIREGEYTVFELISTGAPEFSDVDAEDYFYEPVNWAVEKGITNGMGHGKFGPKVNCQRAQVVTFLWRYMGKPQPESMNNPFDDLSNDYYYVPVLWAVEEEITNGMGHGKFGPKLEVTRGQFVTFLWRAAGCPEPKNTSHPFTDLDEDEYYYKAVLWAVENGITNGMKPTEFQPEFICRREQVVTFLYRSQGIVLPEGVG